MRTIWTKTKYYAYEATRWVLLKVHPIINWLYSHFELQADMLDLRKMMSSINKEVQLGLGKAEKDIKSVAGAHGSSFGKPRVPGGHIIVLILLSALTIYAQGQKPDKAYMERLHRHKALAQKFTKAQAALNRKLQHDMDEYQGLADWLNSNQPQGFTLDYANELFIPKPAVKPAESPKELPKDSTKEDSK